MIKRLTFLGLVASLAVGTTLAQSSGLAVFTAPLSPSSENPPVEGIAAGGNATVLVHMTRDTAGALTRAVVDFQITFSTEAPINIFAMHIHRGARGANGPVVIDSGFGAATDYAPGTYVISRQNVITAADGLAVVEDLLADPAGYYVNLHSAANRGGVVRGQLMSTDGAAISSLQTQIEDLSAANSALADELAAVKETLARIARRLGVVPKE